MLEKSIKASYLCLLSMFLIIMGILLISLNIQFIDLLIRIISYGFIIKGLGKLLLLIYNRDNRNKEFILKEVADILFGVVIISIKGTLINLLPVTFGLYFLAITIIHIVNYYIHQKNKIKGRLGILILIIINFITSLLLIVNPHPKAKYVVTIIGVYLIIIGLKTLSDFLLEVIPKRIFNKLKMNIKIQLPEIITAFIPQKLISVINEALEIEGNTLKYNYNKQKTNSDLQIILHLAKSGTASMGHIEIAFNNFIYSYGNYDMHSRSLFQAVGDGVILIVDKNKYIEYCVKKRGRYLIEFGLKLTDKEKEIIEKNIDDLINNNTIDYYSDAELAKLGKIEEKEFTDMSSEIYMYANGKYKKIIKGRYKKFFVLNNNCAMMVNKILKNIGKDVMAINGILTPGAYYEYLNNQFIRKNTNVITRKIYTKNDFD